MSYYHLFWTWIISTLGISMFQMLLNYWLENLFSNMKLIFFSYSKYILVCISFLGYKEKVSWPKWTPSFNVLIWFCVITFPVYKKHNYKHFRQSQRWPGNTLFWWYLLNIWLTISNTASTCQLTLIRVLVDSLINIC